MIWRAPWAWLATVAIAVPILVHLLSRRDARVVRFPTLRFIAPSTLTPVRRTRLTDVALLALRCAILVAAVAALAQPLWSTGTSRGAIGARDGRVIVVDTSASMQRASTDGVPALAEARRQAAERAAEVGAARVIETASPGRALGVAEDLLRTQPGLSDIVVISDFQRGAVDSADLSQLAPHLGVTLARIAVVPDSQVVERRAVGGVHVTMSDTGVRATWSTDASAAATNAASAVRVLSADADTAAAAAAERAASRFVLAAGETDSQPVAIVFAGHPTHDALVRAGRPLRRAWMFNAAARVRDDAVLRAAATAVAETQAVVAGDSGLVVMRDERGVPIAVALSAVLDGRETLALLTSIDPGSVAAAALIAAATRETANAVPAAEYDPVTLTEAQLASWARGPTAAPPTEANAGEASDGRWLWVLALVLLAAETWPRRSTRAAPSERAAIAAQQRTAA